MPRILFTVTLLTLLFVHRGTVKAQLPDPVAKIKVMFLYNFTKYIEWPQEYKQGDFIIGILGESQNLKKELEKLATTKKAGIQNIVVKTYSGVGDIDPRCHMLFITEGKSGLINDVSTKLKKSSTLIITEKDGLAKKGAAINFVVKDQKQNFELNQVNAERYNLNVSSNLASLAIKVN